METVSVSNEFESVTQWFTQKIEPVHPVREVLERYHAQHPRAIFLKTLPADATMLDVGAGDGGLEVFRHWPAPKRLDVKLFAYSLEKGAGFDKYDGYELGNWDQHLPELGGKKFDAIYSSHFIEHIKDRSAYVNWCASRLKPGGQVYIEWPAHDSQFCPTNQELSEVGFACITANFHDDRTHKDLPSRADILHHLESAGLIVDAQAIIRMPIFENDLLAHYRETGDVVSLQFAYWLRTGWCQFVTAHAPEADLPEK